MKKVAAILLAFAFLAYLSGNASASTTDPTQMANRMHVVLTTTSDFAQVILPQDVTIINYSFRIQEGAGNAWVEPHKFYIWGNQLGSRAVASFDILVTTDGVSDAVWQIRKGWGQSARVELYNTNQLASPLLLQDQTNNTMADTTSFIVTGAGASLGGPLSAGHVGPKQVFAMYIPWWADKGDWASDPLLTDQPMVPYGTAHPEEVAPEVARAADDGINGFLCSWMGKDHPSDAGFRALLSVAEQRNDFTVAAYIETRVANASHRWDCLPDQACQPDPAYLKQWIADVVTNYGPSHSYLKMPKTMPDGTSRQVPVIFIYWAGDTAHDPGAYGYLSAAQWKQIFDDLHAQGIDAFYMADTLDTSYLSAFDGIHSYADFTQQMTASNSVKTKTWSLLDDPQSQRKLWMGTVMPGYHCLLDLDRDVDRAGGAYYSSQWSSVLAASPDWVMVSTWNQFRENTHIQASLQYGSFYEAMTAQFIDQYRHPNGGSTKPPKAVASGLNAP